MLNDELKDYKKSSAKGNKQTSCLWSLPFNIKFIHVLNTACPIRFLGDFFLRFTFQRTHLEKQSTVNMHSYTLPYGSGVFNHDIALHFDITLLKPFVNLFGFSGLIFISFQMVSESMETDRVEFRMY
ncbi:hypothetical protein BCV71DRAFT_282342 [Rhizopus microsporus]|uniref:Uncharacterized protein n=1 Tax=Rhizopus microsporus TaxID=58291 RepID=A0A1X0S644_RHIZD|nr:hypothetical protein BCV71DRAFT_282342 [Rhizopus microsporus]